MRILLALVLLLPSVATAADRRVMVTSFDRVRVEGPYLVTVASGRGAMATLAGDPRQIEATEVRVDGTTLVVRPILTTTRDVGSAGGPVTVSLSAPALRAGIVLGGGTLKVAGGSRVARLDLSVAGAGSIGWTGADADQTVVTVIGNGQVALAGRAGTARLTINGAGAIDAGAFEVADLTVRVDGPGNIAARARYTATITNTGLGAVTIAGSPKCIVRSAAGGPVTCGAGSP